MANEEKSEGLDVFSGVSSVPPDAIFAVKNRYAQDKYPKKVNLGIGAYRDENGKPYVLSVVREAEKALVARYDQGAGKVSKEYQKIPGDPEFIRLSQTLMLDPAALREGKATTNKRITSGCMAGAQSLSGTGALRVLFAFIKNTLAKSNPELRVFMSNPTWGNHKKIIRDAGLAPNGNMSQIDLYPYIDAKTKTSLDFDGMIECLKTKPKAGDIILLHACAHNPTGVDPTTEQWTEIRKIMKERKLVPFFDCAYQGFATGSLENDAKAVQDFEKDGFDFLLAQSFAKNLGLYGERIGCASVMCQSAAAAKNVQTQLNGVIRPMYSNPPRHGMEIVKFVLSDPKNFAEWEKELKNMSQRINKMRAALRGKLESDSVPSPTGTDWSHITSQIGMFSFTGLSKAQCEALAQTRYKDDTCKEEKECGSVYLLSSGRISMAGLNDGNVAYVAEQFKIAIDTIKTVHVL